LGISPFLRRDDAVALFGASKLIRITLSTLSRPTAIPYVNKKINFNMS
jgi:hypothetical protein